MGVSLRVFTAEFGPPRDGGCYGKESRLGVSGVEGQPPLLDTFSRFSDRSDLLVVGRFVLSDRQQ
jgi:hypothetical protein